MATRSDKVKLGVFLAVTTGLFLIVIIVFAGLSVFKDEKKQYILYDESVSGLQVGAKVKLNGVDIGSVTNINTSTKNMERVRVDIIIAGDAPIKVDSKAFLIMQGITGLKYIDIRKGTMDAKPLKEGEEIEPGKDAISKVMSNVDKYADKVEQILDNIQELTGGENKKNINKAIANLETAVTSVGKASEQIAAITKTINKHLENNPESVDELVANLGDISKNLKASISSANQLISTINSKLENVDLAGTFDGLNQTNQQVQGILVEVKNKNAIGEFISTLNAARNTLTQVAKVSSENKTQIQAATTNLQQATDSFKKFAKTIEETPNSLIFGNTPEPRKIP